MSLKKILEEQDMQNTKLVDLLTHYSKLSDRLQKDLDAARARIAELEKTLITDGCLCGDYEKLSKEFSSIEQAYIDLLPYAPSDEEEYC